MYRKSVNGQGSGESQPSLASVLGKSASQPAVSAGPVEFGRYELIELVGRGGFGEVYRAIDRSTWECVAIKKLIAHRRDEPEAQRRFEAEILAGRNLKHSRILSVLDDGRVNGERYFAVPYIDGKNYLDLIGTAPRPVPESLKVAATVARTVHAGHVAGYVHRDIKPENILIESKTGHPVLADFGLATALPEDSWFVTPDEVVGTQPYMAPEQIDPRLGHTFAAADVYGIGVTLYRALTGVTPFPRRDSKAKDLRAQIKWDRPFAPSELNPLVPSDLDKVCLICLQNSPYDRYQSASELADDLVRIARSSPVHGHQPRTHTRAIRRIRRQPIMSAGVGITLLVAILASFLATQFAGDASTASAELNEVKPKLEQAEDRAEQAGERADEADSRDTEAEFSEAEQAYLASMQAVQRLWDQGQAAAIEGILQTFVPVDGATDHRGLEWYYWMEQLQSVCKRFAVDGTPRGIALGGDGRTLLAVTDTHAEAWDTTTREQLFRKEVGPGSRRGYLFALPPGHTQRAAVSPDGLLLAVTFTGDTGGSLLVWDRTGAQVIAVRGDARLTGHAVEFSPLGIHVVAGTSNGRWIS